MIRKLMTLIKNYDKIMAMIDEKDTIKVTKVDTKEKRYSTFNMPKDQLDYIQKKEKGE